MAHTFEQILSRILGIPGSTKLLCRLFKSLTADDQTDIDPKALPPQCFQNPLVLLSPSRIKVCGFEVETSNRVVRRCVTFRLVKRLQSTLRASVSAFQQLSKGSQVATCHPQPYNGARNLISQQWPMSKHVLGFIQMVRV